MNPQAVSIGGKTAALDRRIGKGGEGDVYLVASDPSLAVKIYTLTNLEDRPAKIRALVQAKLAERAPLVAFPLAEVTANGRFLGFAMRLVSGCKPLHDLYAPGSRKIHFPQADYRFLVRTAANVARAVAAVHRSGCVIGDVNHSGILVSPKAVVSLIDADSFQFTTQSGQFLCKVGVPEYTPPELQGRSLAGVLRTPKHDAFGLAVVIFQLLFMGRHPFVGTVRHGDIPPLHENIAARRYVYTDIANVGMDQPPGTPSVSDFSPQLAGMFDQAFLSKETRPTAEEWVEALDALELKLVKCPDNALHYIPKDASDCAWCDMERQLGTFLFLPYVPAATIVTGADPGADAFNIEAVWRRIQEVKAATDTRVSPSFASVPVTPSAAAKKAKSGGTGNAALGVAIIIGSLVGVVTVPGAFLVWAIAFLIGVNVCKTKSSLDETPFRTAYIAAEQLFQRELANWNRRNGVDDFLSLYSELQAANDEYRRVRQELESEVEGHSQTRKAAQLAAYLDTFPVDQANLKGIGPATKAHLASYGVNTAADVVDGRIQNVPGVGNALAGKLLEWRRKLEQQFVFRPGASTLDRAGILQARMKAETRLVPLRMKLVTGPQNLSHRASRMRQIASGQDVVLSKAKLNRDLARCDLEYLGIEVPVVPPFQTSTPPTPQPASRPASTSPPAAKTPAPWVNFPTSPPPPKRKAPAPPQPSVVTCPRCSQPMVKRLARRGRNAGNYFWGCSRFPTCRGTRNI